MNDDGTPRLLGTEPRHAGERTGRIVQMLMDLVGVPGKVLAERIGMEPTTLSGTMSGRRPWKDTELRQVAAALGFPRATLTLDPDDITASLRTPGRSINYRSA